MRLFEVSTMISNWEWMRLTLILIGDFSAKLGEGEYAQGNFGMDDGIAELTHSLS